jgi:hypothetical protein
VKECRATLTRIKKKPEKNERSTNNLINNLSFGEVSFLFILHADGFRANFNPHNVILHTFFLGVKKRAQVGLEE